MKYFYCALAMVCLVLNINSANAANYQVDHKQSSIAFSGKHAGNPFNGVFEKWDAAIQFDPVDLAASRVEVTIETASAKTGNMMYDGTLPSADWFDAKGHPTATFVSESIVRNADHSFTASGTLTLRGKTQNIAFVFKLTPVDLSTPNVTAHFTLTLDRLAFDIGKGSDASAEWVSKDIILDVTLVAVRS